MQVNLVDLLRFARLFEAGLILGWSYINHELWLMIKRIGCVKASEVSDVAIEQMTTKEEDSYNSR